VLGGLGNIYADESLWYARIHPLARPACLSAVQLEKLRRAVQRVLAAAIRAGGSSISDYRDAEGNPGWFQTCLRAYGRTGKPCRRCGTAIRRIVIAGRSSHFCPQCQRRGPAKNGIQRRD
jgi:formamidopyrimidine-DNA glycosylase